jgi:hypothetical protein
MAKTIIVFWLLFVFADVAVANHACVTESEQLQALELLRGNRDFWEFLCPENDCIPADMISNAGFESIQIPGTSLEVCLVEPTFNVKNKFTGVLTKENSELSLQAVVYNTDIKITRISPVVLQANLVTDNITGDRDTEEYVLKGGQATKPIMENEYNIDMDECRFKLKNPYNGLLSMVSSESIGSYHQIYFPSGFLNPNTRIQFDTRIRFSCESTTKEVFRRFANYELTDNVLTLHDSKTNAISTGKNFYFQGKHWNGVGTTSDIVSDEKITNFSFCIPNGAFSLCGFVYNIGNSRAANRSVLPQIIETLKTIEFLPRD